MVIFKSVCYNGIIKICVNGKTLLGYIAPRAFFFIRRYIFMPHSPPRPCRQPGCPNLTHDRYCAVHAPAHQRDSAHKRGYDSRWRRWSIISSRTVEINGSCGMRQTGNRYASGAMTKRQVPLTVYLCISMIFNYWEGEKISPNRATFYRRPPSREKSRFQMGYSCG